MSFARVRARAIALGQRCVVQAVDIHVSELRVLREAIQARMLGGEFEECIKAAALGVHAVFDAGQCVRRVFAQGVADVLHQF